MKNVEHLVREIEKLSTPPTIPSEHSDVHSELTIQTNGESCEAILIPKEQWLKLVREVKSDDFSSKFIRITQWMRVCGFEVFRNVETSKRYLNAWIEEFESEIGGENAQKIFEHLLRSRILSSELEIAK